MTAEKDNRKTNLLLREHDIYILSPIMNISHGMQLNSCGPNQSECEFK